jgi:RHS repeat-associated protein
MAFSYDAGFTQKQFSGNISGWQWRSIGDGEERAYGFGYDAVNRLTAADFTQNNNGWNNSAGVDFTVSNLTYDANGNIKRMDQKGLKINSSSLIDQLAYSYFNNSNKLSQVVDGSNDSKSTLGDFKYDAIAKTSTDYIYDVNGNMIADKNKDITISYNHLNLPVMITVKNKGVITYMYDASGKKLQKSVVDNTINPSTTTVTRYLDGSVYENDILLYTMHEEGRIRIKPGGGGIAYDYFIKDHLGNVRMVLTYEKRQDIYPAATLETLKAATEEKYYEIKSSQVVDKPASLQDYPNNNSIPNPIANPSFDNAYSAKVYRLNSNVQRTGLGIVLKVMSGDRLNIFGKSYYSQPNSGGNNANANLTALEIINGLLLTPGAKNSVKGTANDLIGNTTGTAVPLGSFLNNNSMPTQTTPRAFVVYILFDEQFKFVKGGVSPVSSSESTIKLKDHFPDLQDIRVTKNGFVYVYCSNESPVDVYFDNLQVVHTRGPILEETHYYPFGLVMAGISSKAAGVLPNKEQTFQEQRFDDDLGLNLISFKWRTHDPQTGRFLQVDPLSDDYRYQSPYNFSENRVTDGREMEGMEYVSIHHYANGTNGIKMHYKSTDKDINKIHGTTAGFYNSVSYGPAGKGVVHYYYNSEGGMDPEKTRWEQRQSGGSSDYRFHGLYSGPGSITKDGGENSSNFDFSFQPIDLADAIAKRHDMDYVAATATGEKYAGFLEDIRTVQADKEMVQRIKDYTNPFKKVKGVETPFRTSYSEEMDMALVGQRIIIDALVTYKEWKIENGYGNKDTYERLRDKFKKRNPGTSAIIDLIVQ